MQTTSSKLSSGAVGDAIYQEVNPEDLVNDYLDHLCAPLVGVVPYAERSRLRDEAAFNIEGRVKQYELDGLSPVDAVTRAIEKYGRSDVLSERFLVEWTRYQPKGILARRIGLSRTYAAVFFGQPLLWCFLLVQIRIYFPDPQPYTFGLKMWELRRLIPEPLPIPELSPTFFALWALCFFSPVVAGYLTGSRIPVHASSTALSATLACFGLAAMASLITFPVQEAMLFAAVVLLWWVPAGVLSAHFAGAAARCRRIRYQAPQ